MCAVRTMEVKRPLMVNDHAGTVHERNLTNFNWIFVNSAEVGNIVDIYLKAHLPKYSAWRRIGCNVCSKD